MFYRAAKNEKILIFSDTHFGNDFQTERFGFLAKAINDHDKVIVLGDFYESYSISFDSFLKSEWNRLFPLLKNKHAIYIWGNHDHESAKFKEASLIFCDAITDDLVVESGGEKFNVFHGDKYCITIDRKLKVYLLPRFIQRILLRLNGYAKKQRKHINFLQEKLKFGESIFSSNDNEILKAKIKENSGSSSTNDWAICGHTHMPEIDRLNKFANCGFVGIGFYSFLTLQNGDIQMTVKSEK